MKKVLSLFAALLITIPLTLTAFADDDDRVVQAFRQENYLYALSDISSETSEMNVEAQIKSEPYKIAPPGICDFEKSGMTSSYLLLVDTSLSMNRYSKEVYQILNDFITNADENTKFMLSSFGREYTQITDYSADKDTLLEKSKKIVFDQSETSLYRAVIDALGSYEKSGRDAGEIQNIVLITDANESDEYGNTQAEVLQKIDSSVPVFIHTIGLYEDASSATESIKVLASFSRASGGFHSVYDADNSENAADNVLGYIDGLVFTKFNVLSLYNADEYDVSLFFTEPATSKMLRLDYAGAPALDIRTPETGSPLIVPPATTSSESDNTDTPDTENTTSDSLTGDETSGSDTSADSSQTTTDDGNKNRSEKSNMNIILILIICGSAAIAVIAVIVLVVVLKKKSSAPVPQEIPAGALYIRAEITRGNAVLAKNDYYLCEQLIIGRGSDCDICVNSPDVSGKNSRLFMRDNTVYIEDLDSLNGTALCNMKIFAANKLISGDEIIIGSIGITFKF